MATDFQTHNEPSVASLVKGIIDDVQDLTKQQFNLLKQELKEDTTKTVQATVPMAVGGIVTLVGILLLGHALAWVLVNLAGLPQWAAYLIVGGVITGIGAVLVYLGLHKFRTFNPLPDRSLEALKENVQCLTNPK
jgi:uncharacterized membrane protein YqjE